MNIIEKNNDSLRELCKKHKVSKLYIFGSVNNKRFSKESDIDFLVTFGKIELLEYADNYFDFKFSLEDLFKRDIDLLEEKTIKNPFFRSSINESKQLVYG